MLVRIILIEFIEERRLTLKVGGVPFFGFGGGVLHFTERRKLSTNINYSFFLNPATM